MTFMDEAFQRHDAATPGEADTSAFAASQWTLSGSESGTPRAARLGQARSQPRTHERELLAVFPDSPIASLLVDNYFDKIHWFMLVFFQSEFKERFQSLCATVSDQQVGRSLNTGFLSLVLAVCLTSLRYTSAEQKSQLISYGIDPESLQERLLTTLRLRLLDVVSLGSIEAVQMCILLGSFYLYHGEPELAWPICGCGLRIAQALNLHRRASERDSDVPDLDDTTQRAIETRKRCWWAIYEIETFCSMLYGFPLSIVENDCDVGLPNPYPLRSKDTSWNASAWKAAGKATLLSYKYAMGQLSVIVKSALAKLYRTQRRQLDTGDGADLQPLIADVTNLDSRLRAWWRRLPRELLLTESMESQSESTISGLSGVEDLPGQEQQRHLFRVQALAIKLAFENARILVHRPLLSYKAMSNGKPPDGTSATRPSMGEDPLRFSIQACRHAALQIAKVSSTSHFKEAADTYAVSFVALHLFTAGVTLSIMASLEPLSQDSFESKMGLRQLMAVHSQLKSKSIVAEQGLEILKKLMMLVMSKETERMLQLEVPSNAQVQGAARVETSSRTGHPEQQCLHEAEAAGNCGREEGASNALNPIADPDTTVTANELDISQVSFCEDPLVAQALLDFEQAMSYHIDDISAEGVSEFSDPFIGSCFGTHDQGWIWNYRN